jgi:predicted ATPase
MDFKVQPKSNPPSNIHVIIGRNGVGKTRLINNMIHSIIEEKSIKFGKFNLISEEEGTLFSNLVSVTFSAFDTTEPIRDRKKKDGEITYSYIGLRTESSKGDGTFVTKSLTKLKNEFVRSAYKCIIGGKKRRLKAAIKSLEADAIFNDANLTNVLEIEQKSEFESTAGVIFNKLSSGHMIVLLTITRLVETIEEKSLVLIDEPETHLHPPLLSAFVRALSDLLTSKNAVAIVATHSPVVLQEVPRVCCRKLDRAGYFETVIRPELESFGENVGALTQEVFGLEVTHSGFHQILRKIVAKSITYNNAINQFDNQLGFEAKAILRVLMNEKQKDDQ